MTPFEFSEHFKSLSNTELLEILERPGNYQKDAVDAAKSELANRQLSETTIDMAKEAIVARKAASESKKERLLLMDKRIKDAAFPRGGFIKPGSQPTPGRIINAISFVVGILTVLGIIINYDWLWINIEQLNSIFSSALIPLLPYVISALAAVLFFYRKILGWFLLCALAIYFVLNASVMLLSSFARPASIGTYNLDLLTPKYSPGSFILPLVIFSVVLFQLVKPAIRDAFGVTKSKMISALAWIAGIIVFVITVVFLM